jgi:hypothetical protein
MADLESAMARLLSRLSAAGSLMGRDVCQPSAISPS